MFPPIRCVLFQSNAVCCNEKCCHGLYFDNVCVCVCLLSVSDGKEYALKLIEGTGISMSACREIAVSFTAPSNTATRSAVHS